MSQAPDIIFFSGIEWHGQNRMPCHHLVEQLSRHHRIFYINNFGALRYLDRHDFLRCFDKVRGLFRGKKNPHLRVELNPVITVWQPWIIPSPRGGLIAKLNVWLLLRSIKKLYGRYNIQQPIIWTRLPTNIVWDVIEKADKRLFVYQSIDKFPEHPRISKDLRVRYRDCERLFNRSADVVFASARGLWAEKKKHNQNAHFIPNGVSESFADGEISPIPEMRDVSGAVVGFAGALGTATDNLLLSELVSRMPDVTFVFLGTIDRTESLHGLDEAPNVIVQGIVPHNKLMSWFEYFDVGLMPYRINHFQHYTFPSKMAEYLMGGLPIVSTPLPEVKHYSDVVHVVDNVDEMVDVIRDFLARDSRRDQALIDRRHQVAESLTWEAQVEKIESVIADAISEGEL